MVQWLRALYCSASCAIRVPGFAPRLCCNREVRGATHNWPSIVWVRESVVSRDVLVSSCTSDSCGGPGAVRANQGCQVHGVSSDHFSKKYDLCPHVQLQTVFWLFYGGFGAVASSLLSGLSGYVDIGLPRMNKTCGGLPIFFI